MNRNYYSKNYMKNFKNGVADALLYGNMTNKYGDGYKAGYDFGLVMFNELDKSDKIWIEFSGKENDDE